MKRYVRFSARWVYLTPCSHMYSEHAQSYICYCWFEYHFTEGANSSLRAHCTVSSLVQFATTLLWPCLWPNRSAFHVRLDVDSCYSRHHVSIFLQQLWKAEESCQVTACLGLWSEKKWMVQGEDCGMYPFPVGLDWLPIHFLSSVFIFVWQAIEVTNDPALSKVDGSPSSLRIMTWTSLRFSSSRRR